jgi:hypothetical protein
MVELITGLRAAAVRANLERVQGEIAAALARSQAPRTAPGRGGVEVLAAT